MSHTMGAPPADGASLTIRLPEAGERRLDRALAVALPALSRARLRALMAAGAVLGPDGPLTDPAARPTPGTLVTVRVPPAAEAAPRPQAIPLSILYEDEDVLALDKPAGLVVHPGAGVPDGTLVNALLAHCGESLSGIGGVRRPGIVHRLDRDTSGVMVVAKTDRAHRHLARQLASRTLTRLYRAVVWGAPPAEARITAPIGRDPRTRTRMAVVAGGRQAATNLRRLTSVGTRASLVECRLETGRTHQIRVHLAHLGFPVVGDAVYGGRPGRASRLPAGLETQIRRFGRQALHAWRLAMIHPVTGETLRVEAPIPLDFATLITDLERF